MTPVFFVTMVPVAGDFDRDGNTDVVAALMGAATITWYKGISTWTPTSLSGNVWGATDVYLVDLNGDGWLDVLATGEGDSGTHNTGSLMWGLSSSAVPTSLSVIAASSYGVVGAQRVMARDLTGAHAVVLPNHYCRDV